jgi:hypothetical protein
MALASDTITGAFRESNLISLAATPTTPMQAEALGLLNSILMSTLGNDAGTELRDLNIGGSYDDSAWVNDWVPENARLVCNISAPETLKLDPRPYEGQRLALVDAAGNFATNSLTLDANGKNIEFQPTLVLGSSVPAQSWQWFYRADIGNWQPIAQLALSDLLPFPVEFDSYFQTRLALRLNPRYAQALSQESANELARQENLINARYRRPRPPQDQPRNRGFLATRRFYGSNSSFFTGRPRW